MTIKGHYTGLYADNRRGGALRSANRTRAKRKRSGPAPLLDKALA